MAKLTPKQIYELIVIHKQQPSPEQLKELEGTHWHHRLHGTSPTVGDIFKAKKFKTYYEEEDTVSHTHVSLSDFASHLIDRLEDKYNLHFSSDERPDDTKLNDIKQYISAALAKAVLGDGDRKSVVRAVNSAQSVSGLMIKLHDLSLPLM